MSLPRFGTLFLTLLMIAASQLGGQNLAGGTPPLQEALPAKPSRPSLPLGIAAPQPPSADALVTVIQPSPTDFPAAPQSLTVSTLPLDISTASFYELVDWLRSLDLTETGGIADLRSRLYAYYKVSPPLESAAAGRTVTIESANRVVYGEEGQRSEDGSSPTAKSSLTRLSGGVRLTIKDAGSADTYTIAAREVVYDRERNSVFASGNVVYTRSGQGRMEEFRGNTLSADLSDWSGLFLDGVWRRDKAGIGAGDRGLIFTASTLDKSSGDFFTLIDATVSPSAKTSPNFSIRAQRLWFLGGNDWAALSALLYLGEVPLLWIPFFYYPSEEIVFHPVFGYRDREGRFLQTTTYLIGQKPPSKTGSTILKLAPETGPTVPRGLFLKRVSNTDPATATKATTAGAAAPGAAAGQSPSPSGAPTNTGGGTAGTALSSDSLKFLADVYDGLGFFVGLDGTLASLGPFSRVALSSGFGLSRSLFPSLYTTASTPYSATGNWVSQWNSSEFLGLGLPLRFGISLASNLTLGLFNASFELPLYSDPFFESDFRNRSEDMDWLQFSTPAATLITSTIVKRTTFSDKFTLSGAYRPSFLAPWLGSANLSRLASSLTWRSKPDQLLASVKSYGIAAVDPAREFFMPDVLRPLDLTVDLSGSIFEFPVVASGTSKAGQAQAPSLPLRAPWDVVKPPASTADTQTVVATFPPPPIAPDPPHAADSPPISVKLGWTLQPGLVLERRFLSDAWNGVSAIDYSSLYDLVSWRTGAALNSSLALWGNALGGSANLAWTSQDQTRSVTDNPNFAYTKSSLLLSDQRYSQSRLLGTFRLSSQPLSGNDYFGSSSLNWSLGSTLYSRIFDKLVGTDPSYKESFPSWDSTYITSHSLGLTIALRTGSKTQSITLTANLPPTSESWSGSIALDIGVFGYSLGLGVQERAGRTSADAPLVWSPASATLRAGTPIGLVANNSVVYDFSKGYPISNVFNLAWDWASLSYQIQRTKASIPTATGWVTSSDDAFLPTSFSFSLAPKYQAPTTDVLRPSASVNLAYNQSLLRFTDSTLTLGITAGIALGSGFTLTFSTQSQNKLAWEYLPSAFPAVSQLSGGASAWLRNPLEDILDSLTFWDSKVSSKGNFKLKNLAFSLTQDLEDWTLNIQASAIPKLDTANKIYYIDPSLSLTIAWKDIPEMKSAISYLDKKLSW